MAYLLKTKEVYRVEDEESARAIIENAKADGYGDIINYTCKFKEKKATKNSDYESWYLVSLEREFCKEKEPDGFASVSYEV